MRFNKQYTRIPSGVLPDYIYCPVSRTVVRDDDFNIFAGIFLRYEIVEQMSDRLLCIACGHKYGYRRHQTGIAPYTSEQPPKSQQACPGIYTHTGK